MFKFILIVSVVFYLIYKIGSFFFRAGAAAQHFREFQQQQKKGFDRTNGAAKQTQTKEGKYKGGEYIDYEEIKK